MQNDTSVSTGPSGSAWSMALGILMVICGILAIALPLASSIGVVLVVGWLILLVGVWHLIFVFHSHSFGGVLWQLLLAVVEHATPVRPPDLLETVEIPEPNRTNLFRPRLAAAQVEVIP